MKSKVRREPVISLDGLSVGPEDIVRLLGVSAAKVQQWMNRDLLPFEVIRQGDRTQRRFLRDQFFLAAAMVGLHRQGLEPSVARRIVDAVKEAIGGKIRDSGGLRELWETTGFLVVGREGDKYATLRLPATTGTTLRKAFSKVHSEDVFIVDLRPIMKLALEGWDRASREVPRKQQDALDADGWLKVPSRHR